MNRDLLKEQYNNLLNILGMNIESGYDKITFYIKDIINEFMHTHGRVGIYCYGVHTQMLMTEFIAELRDVVCVIDNGKKNDDSEFIIIKDADIEKYELDGILISTFQYRNEIKQNLMRNHKMVDVLDIYDELKKYGMYLEEEFFFEGSYQIYKRINVLFCQLSETNKLDIKRKLLKEFVNIKDFRMAEELAADIYSISHQSEDKNIFELVTNIYRAEIHAVECIKKDNILLLCMDGMKRDDYFEKLPKICSTLNSDSYVFRNAYSFSTMTYESLVPVFSENTDQKTNYFRNNEVSSAECRFIDMAIKDKRFVAIYGDGCHYVYDEKIKYTGRPQTITEKLWDFTIDADGVDAGLFYIHELYESHYSFANPYTKSKLISNGSALLFDYLPHNKGRLRTDYKMQQEDALRYLDDTLNPFLEALSCNLVLFADHGNLILEKETELKDIKPLQLSVAEEWIRIPLLIKSDKCGICQDNRLISLLELNSIMVALLNGEKYIYEEKDYIKIGRSAIYNQQFKEIYRMLSLGYNGEALEGFIFKDGYKLIVFEDGRKELYSTVNDVLVDDKDIIEILYERIKDEVTIL